MKETLKKAIGGAVSRIAPQSDYSRCVFILAHMRCGSTALSNVFCSRPDFSGYGEAHIRYDDDTALGRLIVNQTLRRAWSPDATFLFDKILHNRYDMDAQPHFFAANAVFMARDPAEAIPSIRRLFKELGREHEYPTDEDAARYYIDRVECLCALWSQFRPDRRVGLLHSDLMRDVDGTLARLSKALNLKPMLENRYQSATASRRGGAGDPLESGAHVRIEARKPPQRTAQLELERSSADAAAAVFRRFKTVIGRRDE
ncbi:MAG: sulfotransferase [Pseudomonadota bacterium]